MPSFVFFFYFHSRCRNCWDDTGDLNKGFPQWLTRASACVFTFELEARNRRLVSGKKKKDIKESKTYASNTTLSSFLFTNGHRDALLYNNVHMDPEAPTYSLAFNTQQKKVTNKAASLRFLKKSLTTTFGRKVHHCIHSRTFFFSPHPPPSKNLV